ncbi:MAG: TVP38/TMEM64 family protein [Woeseiaceae bacterium]|nr:TVP38/TMEM64 family protein [Woeseiaceae bacterium]
MKVVMRRISYFVVFTVLMIGAYYVPLDSWVSALVVWGYQHPIASPVVYIFFVIIATVLFLPGSVAMMISGFLFGFLPGLVFAIVAVPLGAQAAFKFGRWFARPWVQQKVATHDRMQAIEAALHEEAFIIVALTRLSLIIPFNLLNYAYGASSVKASVHFIATAVGMLPAITLYVYFGTLARDLGQILSNEATPSELGYWIIVVGVIAIVFATWIIHKTATRALEKHLNNQEKAE